MCFKNISPKSLSPGEEGRGSEGLHTPSKHSYGVQEKIVEATGLPGSDRKGDLEKGRTGSINKGEGEDNSLGQNALNPTLVIRK